MFNPPGDVFQTLYPSPLLFLKKFCRFHLFVSYKQTSLSFLKADNRPHVFQTDGEESSYNSDD